MPVDTLKGGNQFLSAPKIATVSFKPANNFVAPKPVT